MHMHVQAMSCNCTLSGCRNSACLLPLHIINMNCLYHILGAKQRLLPLHRSLWRV